MTPERAIKVFLLTHMVERKFILDFLDTRPEILNWFAVSDQCVLIASRGDLTAITGIIHVQMPWLYFTISEVTPASINGWMPREFWNFISSPQSSGRWE